MSVRAPPYWDKERNEACVVCQSYSTMIVEDERSRPGRRNRLRRRGVERAAVPFFLTQSTIRRHIGTLRHIQKYLSLRGQYLERAKTWLINNSLYDIQINLVNNLRSEVWNENRNEESNLNLGEEDGLVSSTHVNDEDSCFDSDMGFNVDELNDTIEQSDEIYFGDAETSIDSEMLGFSDASFNGEDFIIQRIKAVNTGNQLDINLCNLNEVYKLGNVDNEWFPFSDANTCRIFLILFYVFDEYSEAEKIKIFNTQKMLLMANNIEFKHTFYSIKKLLNLIPMPAIKNCYYEDKNQEKHVFSMMCLKDVLAMCLWDRTISKNLKSNAENTGVISDIETGEKWTMTRKMQSPYIFFKGVYLWQGNTYEVIINDRSSKLYIVFHSYQVNKTDKSLTFFYIELKIYENKLYVVNPDKKKIASISSKEIKDIKKVPFDTLQGIIENELPVQNSEIVSGKHWITKKSRWQRVTGSAVNFKSCNLIFWTDGVKISKHKAVESFSIELAGLPRSGGYPKRSPIQLGIAVKNTSYSMLKAILKPIISDIRELESGFITFDSASQSPVIVKGTVAFTKGDNLVQNEIASFPTGSKTNCRICYYKENLNGDFYETDKLKSAEEIRKLYRPESLEAINNINRGLKSQISIQESPFLELDGFDGALDTPTDILHTIFLGIVKYLSLQARNAKQDAEQKIFAAKLDASDFTYLPISLTGTKYKSMGSFVAKEMHAFLSVAPFIFYSIFEEASVAFSELAWLTKLLHVNTINSIDEYIKELTEQIETTISAINNWSPSILQNKIKTHLLYHFPLWIKRHGTCLGYSTELNESSNILLKKQIQNTNFSALSKDVATKNARSFGINFLVKGGYFPWEESNKIAFYKAGNGLLQIAKELGKLKYSKEKDSERVRVKNFSFVTGLNQQIYYINDDAYTSNQSVESVKVYEFTKTNSFFRHGMIIKLVSSSIKTIQCSELLDPINVAHYCSIHCKLHEMDLRRYEREMISGSTAKWKHDIFTGTWVINPFITSSKQ